MGRQIAHRAPLAAALDDDDRLAIREQLDGGVEALHAGLPARTVDGRERGSIRATATHFNRDRRQIYRWMERSGIDKSARDD